MNRVRKKEKWRIVNANRGRKWGRRRGRGKKKIKGKFVSLVDDDVSKRAKFLSFKKWRKNHFWV